MTVLLFNEHNVVEIKHCNYSFLAFELEYFGQKEKGIMVTKLCVFLSFTANKLLIGDEMVHVYTNYFFSYEPLDVTSDTARNSD